MKITNSEPNPVPQSLSSSLLFVTIIFALKCSLKHCISSHCATMTTTNEEEEEEEEEEDHHVTYLCILHF